MDRKLYNLSQWTWGLPQTLLGAGLFLKHRKDRHYKYKGASVTAWDRDDGLSLGKFIFVPSGSVRPGAGSSDEASGGFMIDHEYGHSVQSLLLGPAYLLLVGIPSSAWNRLPYFERKRREQGRSYYSAVFERTANRLGGAGTDGSKAARRDSRDRTERKR